jgi:hypothetical protein
VHGNVVAEQGDIAAFARDLGTFQRMEVFPLRYFTLHVVHEFVFIDEHRIIAAHGGFQQPVGLARTGWGDHAQPGDTHEYLFHTRRMLRTQLVRRAARRTYHDRRSQLATGHVTHLGSRVENLVHGKPGKIH